MSESKNTSDDGSVESRGLRVCRIDRDEEEEEGAILMVRVIRVEVERVHFE